MYMGVFSADYIGCIRYYCLVNACKPHSLTNNITRLHLPRHHPIDTYSYKANTTQNGATHQNNSRMGCNYLISTRQTGNACCHLSQ